MRSGALAPVTLIDLARALGTKSPATSAMVDRLTHAGLVRRTLDPRGTDLSAFTRPVHRRIHARGLMRPNLKLRVAVLHSALAAMGHWESVEDAPADRADH